MTDIVERLSENSKRAESPIDALAMKDAAAEIARLRTKVAKADALAEALSRLRGREGPLTSWLDVQEALAAYREGSDK